MVRWMERAALMLWLGQALAEETQAEAIGGGGWRRTEDSGFMGMMRLSGDSSFQAVGDPSTLQSSREEVSCQGEPEEARRGKG